MTHRLNVILLSLALLFGLPYYWYLLDNSGADLPAKPITIVQLRNLAASLPGQAPTAVRRPQTIRSRRRRHMGDTLR